MDENPYSPQSVHADGRIVVRDKWRFALATIFILIGAMTFLLFAGALFLEFNSLNFRIYRLYPIVKFISRLITIASSFAWIYGGIAVVRRNYKKGFLLAGAAFVSFFFSIFILRRN